jgi:XTP/dITP diphosphohydrolase
LRGARHSVYFATHNRGKYLEASRITETLGIHLKQLNITKEEIQADSLTKIASHAALQATKSTRHRVVSEDAGFFVEALGGFPGPYSAYVFRTLGTEGILRLMHGVRNRKASFRAALAYCQPGKHSVCFNGVVKGVVSLRCKGTHGFGFDPIFIPLKGDGRTFAEMTIEEKNAISHRAIAFKQFSRWFSSKQE